MIYIVLLGLLSCIALFIFGPPPPPSGGTGTPNPPGRGFPMSGKKEETERANFDYRQAA